jgi:hypothetical protein
LGTAAQAARADLELLVIETADGRTLEFQVEIADTPERRARGLMFRETLATRSGMLFEFPERGPVAFWMKNTPLSLDILFIEADGRIVRIAERTEPFSLRPIPSRAPVTGVLEVLAGTAETLGLRPGDRVRHPFFQSGNPPADTLAPAPRSP